MVQQRQLVNQFKELVGSIGRNAAHNLYPNDFEAYVMALELVDSQDRTVDFFVFPVMPDSFSEDYSKISNTRKTAGGITALTSPNFTSRTLTIDGNFGYNFKFLLGNNLVDASAIQFSTVSGNYKGQIKGKGAGDSSIDTFSKQLKTGYGCYKVLYGIHEKSTTLDDNNQPFKLFFYNLAQGEHFLVKSLSLRSNQTLDQNMIWEYEYQMEAVAPISGSKPNFRQTIEDITYIDNVNKIAEFEVSAAKLGLETAGIL